MLFNSYVFILLFLPVVIAGFVAISYRSRQMAIVWLTVVSLFFYGYWNAPYVLLLLASVVANFLIGRRISLCVNNGAGLQAKVWTATGVLLNLSLLGYYKYANFFVDNANAIFGVGWDFGDVLLPIGISFYTFTQIAYLVDCRKSIASSYNLWDYTLFVTFFPQLIAGPILHHKEIVPQFESDRLFRVTKSNLAIGLTIFTIGLFKKAVIADGIAVYASPVFAATDGGLNPDFLTAWGGALAYTFQLYFDFSGYSDMAIGLSRIFGIVLPVNFASPYKSLNIQTFWRNWHITLSRFLREYLYIPLGGSRKGPVRRVINLLATMLLGGLWHGAGWNYIVWGALHGLFLVINHAWRGFFPSFGRARWQRVVAWILTFVCVVIAWVFFRSETIDGSFRMIFGMFGSNGVSLPNAIMVRLGSAGEFLSAIGVNSSLGGGSAFMWTWCWVFLLLAMVLACPNTQQLVLEVKAEGTKETKQSMPMFKWSQNAPWAIAIGTMAATGLLSLSRVSEFLYFQF